MSIDATDKGSNIMEKDYSFMDNYIKDYNLPTISCDSSIKN